MFINKRLTMAFLVMLLLIPKVGYAVDLEVSAFGDVTFGGVWGKAADEEAEDLFEDFGIDDHPLHQNTGFGQGGIDFTILGELNNHLTLLSEINLEVEGEGDEGAELSVDVERVYLDYRINNKFNLQVGSFFTPIGFHGRTLYSRAWLMYSIHLPDFDDETLGFVPNHSTGLHLYGNVPTLDAHSINYAVSIANSRGMNPTELVLTQDDDDRKTVTALFEWVFPNLRDFRIGLSGWMARINTIEVGPNFGDDGDPETDDPVQLDELGFNPYLVVYSEHVNLILEYVSSTQEDNIGNLAEKSYDFESLFAELSLNLMDDKLHPYVRYDFTEIPGNGGPYIPIRMEGEELERVYIPEFEAVFLGVAYDLFALNRIKVEFARHMKGAHAKYGITIQTAYAF